MGQRKVNEYDLSNSYGIGYTTNTHEAFFFDLEDYDKIKVYSWRAVYSRKDGDKEKGRRIEMTIPGTTRKIRLHRFVTNAPVGKEIDHKNRNPFDNRKCNLRVSTRAENSYNRSIQEKNKTGYIGVGWDEEKNRYYAFIKKDGRTFVLGHFKSKKKAVKARLTAEVVHFGEFAPQRHLYSEFGINEAKIKARPKYAKREIFNF